MKSTLLYGFICTAWLLGCATPSQVIVPPHGDSDENADAVNIKKFLSTIYVDIDDKSSYEIAFNDLNNDGELEGIVILKGGAWCGTGGCTLLIISPEHKRWRLVTKIPASRLPVRVLSTSSNGWRDLSVRIQGGGVDYLNSSEVLVEFNGKDYVLHAEKEISDEQLRNGLLILPVDG